MSIKSKDELLNGIRDKIGDNTDDDTLSFLEDVADTLSDYESRINDSTDWKSKYEENDKEWRKRYTDRFFNKPETEIEPTPIPKEEPKKLTFEDLFN